jgi:formylglycine-generating enzyme required for sulfatase activity
MDLYEVTVGRFRAFLDSGRGTSSTAPAAGEGAHPLIAGSGWKAAWGSYLVANTAALRAGLVCSPTLSAWTDTPGGNELRPINCVTWFEAFAFCAWDGGRLPTEAEWNFAAAGGAEQRVFPWSSPPTATSLTPSHASYWENGTDQCMGDGVPGCTVEDLVFVGSKAPGRYGHDSLAGNVWEWVLDVYANPYGISPCNDCAALGTDTANRVMRGGSFFGNQSTLYASTRNPGGPTQRFYTAGIRCARALPE